MCVRAAGNDGVGILSGWILFISAAPRRRQRRSFPSKMAEVAKIAALLAFFVVSVHAASLTNARKKSLFDDTQCPKVKPMRSFDLAQVSLTAFVGFCL
jgi:hypothetical protein